eukprot:4814682-Prymnesium_polylepis.2
MRGRAAREGHTCEERYSCALSRDEKTHTKRTQINKGGRTGSWFPVSPVWREYSSTRVHLYPGTTVLE